MSDFAGMIRTDGGPVPPAAADRLARVLHGTGKPRSWSPNPGVVLAERRGIPSFDNGCNAAPIQIREDRTLLVSARLDRPGEVKAALGLDGPGMPDDRSLTAAAALRWGTAEAAERMHGDFVIAEWDAPARRLTIARDAMGVRPIYYAHHDGWLVFATTLQAMRALPEVPRDLDEVMLAHSMTFALQDQERTLYRHIRRVPPGGTLVFEKGEVRTRRWFRLERLSPTRFARDEDYVEAARELLDRAVAARLPASGRTGITLSGGFDSTGIAATAAKLLRETPLYAFTRAPGADHPYDRFDEQEMAALVAARYPNIDWTVIADTDEFAPDSEPEIEAGVLGVPRRGSFNGAWFYSLNKAMQARGIDVVLNGGAGNSVLSWAGAPELGKRLRSLQLRGLIGDLRGLGRERGCSPMRAALGEAWRGLAPRALQRMRIRRAYGHGETPWLAYSLVAPGFLADIDYDAHSRACGHDIPFDAGLDSRAMRLALLQGQTGRDFAGFTRKRWSYATRDPFLDRALVEFALTIPEDQYWRGGKSRWLARRVLADRVPAEILGQRRRGKQSPEWYHLATSRREETAQAIERIARSPLASRVVDIPRMRSLLETWPNDAESAMDQEMLYGHALHRAVSMGGFLRAIEGGNE